MGLLRGVARTAVVADTATAVSNRTLAELKGQGVLTDAEFEQQKARILNG